MESPVPYLCGAYGADTYFHEIYNAVNVFWHTEELYDKHGALYGRSIIWREQVVKTSV